VVTSSGHDAFFDLPGVMERYGHLRDRLNDGNALMEEPHVIDLLGDVKDRAIVDLGCGDGRFGVWLAEQGCSSYTGLDASTQMVGLARTRLARSPHAKVVVQDINDWRPAPGTAGLVTARMSLHYIQDLPGVIERVGHCLIPGGRFVLSVEHPVITSDYTSASGDDVPDSWRVTNYFVRGPRTVQWLGQDAIKYHRTMEDYFRILQQTGLAIHQLREGEPVKVAADAGEIMKHRMAVPITLILSAVKST
jgi:trans-aconitate methyltransferase